MKPFPPCRLCRLAVFTPAICWAVSYTHLDVYKRQDCKLRAKNCGGCPLLGLDYAEQLKQKEEKVRALVGK